MDYNTFANNIKLKYPEYKDEDNLELSKKIVAKYPQYKEQVSLPSDNYFSRVGERLKSAGQDVFSGVQAGQEIKTSGQQDVQQGGFLNTLKGLAKQKIGDVKSKLAIGGGVARGISSLVEEAPVVKQTMEAVGGAIAPAIQSGLETDTGQKILELQKQYPEAFKSLQDVVDIASLIPVGAGAKVGVEGAELATKGALKATKELPSLIKKAPNAVLDTLATENPVKLAKIKTGVAKNLNEYADEFSRSRNAISGATNKIEGFDYGNYVAEKNLLPDVTDSGRFDGRNIIKGLQEENTQLKNIVSNKLDNSVRSTPVESFKQSLLEDITSKGNIADADSMRSYVDRYINEVRNRYGDNLTDRQLYDIKVDADAGYNYLSPNADINASKLIADRARNFIRSKDEEIAKALDAQTKNYEAIRITQSLEPYKVKAGNLTTRLAQLGGSLLGANAVEGGIIQKTLAATIGGLAGQKLVKALQQAAFISPASRRAIEKELMKKVKPEAVKTILKKLDNGVNLSEVETKALERAGNQLKKSSIMTNDKTTAINTPIKESIPPNKKSSQAGFISTGKNDYRITHQIQDSIPASDLNNLDDIVKELKTKNGYLTNYDISDLNKLKKLQGNPDMEIKIYRASPKNELNDGDWVTTSKVYANDIKKQNGGKVYEYNVKASDIQFPKNLDDLPSLARFSAFKYSPNVKSISKDLQPLYKEAQKYKSAEEFVKEQGDVLYHGGEKIDNIDLSKSNYDKTFFMSDNKQYTDLYKGKYKDKGVTNEIILSPKANLIDIRKAPESVINKIKEIAKGKSTGKNITITKPDGSKLTIPEVKGGIESGFGNASMEEVIDGAIRGKAHYAEAPGLVKIYKDLGYDGMVTYEDSAMRGKNIGIWNKDVIKTKSQLEQIWKEANSKTSTKQGMTAINPLTVGAGVTALGAGAMSIKNKKKK